MFEHFEHTADLGIRARSAHLNELFEDMARGLFAAIVEDLDAVRPEVEQTIDVPGGDIEYLLFDWLRELLYRFDAEFMLYARFRVSVNEHGLTARVAGELIDEDRHVLAHEVKAITYHSLRVECVGAEWSAEVIVDI